MFKWFCIVNLVSDKWVDQGNTATIYSNKPEKLYKVLLHTLVAGIKKGSFKLRFINGSPEDNFLRKKIMSKTTCSWEEERILSYLPHKIRERENNLLKISNTET